MIISIPIIEDFHEQLQAWGFPEEQVRRWHQDAQDIAEFNHAIGKIVKKLVSGKLDKDQLALFPEFWDDVLKLGAEWTRRFGEILTDPLKRLVGGGHPFHGQKIDTREFLSKWHDVFNMKLSFYQRALDNWN